MNNIETIGLDKILLSTNILRLEKEKLERNKNVHLIENEVSSFYGIQYIKIIDNTKFSTFYAGVKIYKNGTTRVYCRIELSLSFLNIEKNNLRNVSIDEYIIHIENVFKYIKEKYGIELDANHVLIRQMEINCNIILKHAFIEYDEIVEMMMYNLSNKKYQPFIAEYKYINKKNESLDIQTFCRGNKQMEYTIYNKTAQLNSKKKNKNTTKLEVMRIEIRLKNAQKIREVFGTDNIRRIKMSQITHYFQEQLRIYFFERHECWKKENEEKMYKLACKMKKEDKNWILSTFQECKRIERQKNVPIIFDIEDYINVVNTIDKHGHKKRNTAKIKEYNERFGHISVTNNSKMEELKEKIEHM